MHKGLSLIAAAFASLSASPTVSAHTPPDQVEAPSLNAPLVEFGESMRSLKAYSGYWSRKTRLGNIFRTLNQRQHRKLHRQVPQLRKR